MLARDSVILVLYRRKMKLVIVLCAVFAYGMAAKVSVRAIELGDSLKTIHEIYSLRKLKFQPSKIQ